MDTNLDSSSTLKAHDFGRIGNPWLVSHNYGRVVPIYVLHNLLCQRGGASKRMLAIKSLVHDPALVLRTDHDSRQHISSILSLREGDHTAFRDSARGILSPDNRLFRSTLKGMDNWMGRPFPVLHAMLEHTSLDDGLGDCLRNLLVNSYPAVLDGLHKLFQVPTPSDPVTFIAQVLVGDNPDCEEDASNVHYHAIPLTTFDHTCVRFLEALSETYADARRLSTIRRLARGAYLIAILQMVSGASTRLGEPLPLVIAYGGMPHGRISELPVKLAVQSFSAWISTSLEMTIQRMAQELDRVTPLSESLQNARKEKLLDALKNLPRRRRRGDITLEDVDQASRAAPDESSTADWARAILVKTPQPIDPYQLGRRVRSLANNIGFAGPDTGPDPRLILDTPLLEVLVAGLTNGKALNYKTFISDLANKLGIVVGVGSDPTILDRIGRPQNRSIDPELPLRTNQELLRQRLLRIGLARSYSDSHTEVFLNDNKR